MTERALYLKRHQEKHADVGQFSAVPCAAAYLCPSLPPRACFLLVWNCECCSIPWKSIQICHGLGCCCCCHQMYCKNYNHVFLSGWATIYGVFLSSYTFVTYLEKDRETFVRIHISDQFADLLTLAIGQGVDCSNKRHCTHKRL